MDIREFYKSNSEKQQQFNSAPQGDNKNTKDFSSYNETINKYKDLSQDQLMSELLSQASNLKSQGKLDTSGLEQLSSTLGPMLNAEQQQMLNQIIDKLK